MLVLMKAHSPAAATMPISVVMRPYSQLVSFSHSYRFALSLYVQLSCVSELANVLALGFVLV